jgi:hypothetical protein
MEVQPPAPNSLHGRRCVSRIARRCAHSTRVLWQVLQWATTNRRDADRRSLATHEFG